jgi:hypothetical protein
MDNLHDSGHVEARLLVVLMLREVGCRRRLVALLLPALPGPVSLLAAVATLLAIRIIAAAGRWCALLWRWSGLSRARALAAVTPSASSTPAAGLLLARLPLLLRQQQLVAGVHAARLAIKAFLNST